MMSEPNLKDSGVEQLAKWHAKLAEVVSKLVVLDASAVVPHDRAAAMMRKSARSKAVRLLEVLRPHYCEEEASA
jgi:predicted secreted protein